MNKLFALFGFDNLTQLYDSTFHAKTMLLTATLSGILGFLAYYFEAFLGFKPIIGFVILLLVLLEILTGIKASLQDGEKFDIKRFPRGLIKFFIYTLMIGAANLLAVNMSVKMSLNYYEWIHYTFLNLVFVQLFISNIKNFQRLGWNEFLPILGKLHDFLKLKEKK